MTCLVDDGLGGMRSSIVAGRYFYATKLFACMIDNEVRSKVLGTIVFGMIE